MIVGGSDKYGEKNMRILFFSVSFENEQIDQFYRSWSEYDHSSQGYVYLNQLEVLLDSHYDTFEYNKIEGPIQIIIVDALFRYSLREKSIEIKNLYDFELIKLSRR